MIRVESALGSEFVFAGFAYFVRTRLQPNVALPYDNRGIYRRAIKCDNFVFFFRKKKPKKKQKTTDRIASGTLSGQSVYYIGHDLTK